MYGCTTCTLTKHKEKKLDGNCIRNAASCNEQMLETTKQQLYDHLPLISKTIQSGWTRHAGHCVKSKDELISDFLLWTPSHWRRRVGWPARTYLQQLCVDTGCSMQWWTIEMGNERGSRKSMLAACHDDIYIYIYIYIYDLKLFSNKSLTDLNFAWKNFNNQFPVSRGDCSELSFLFSLWYELQPFIRRPILCNVY